MNRLLRFIEVMKVLGIRERFAYELRRTDPDFPKPVFLAQGGKPSWVLDEVEGYIEVLKRRRGDAA